MTATTARALPGQDAQVFVRRDPISGEIVTTAAAMTPDQACAVADAAQAAFPAWAAVGPTERRRILLRVADRLEASTDRLMAVMMGETGAAAPWVGFNCRLAANIVREAASLTTQIIGEVMPSDRPDNLSLVLREPVGVILSIAPWNAPIILAIRAIAFPLACGNAVVLKASEICPGTHKAVVDIFAEAGVPEGVVSLVTHAAEDAAAVVGALVAHKAVKRINFTGSTKVGRIVAGLAAAELKPCLLELGGKAPLIILDDADLEQAVKAAAFGAFMHQGQICMSTERIVVDQAVADEFVALLAVKAASLRAGNPHTEKVPLGSLIDKAAAERIRALIDDAVAKGAVLVAGGQISNTIVQPTVLDRVTPAMRIYQEESFGPAVSVVRVTGIDEAVRVANDTDYGLAAAVYGRDAARAFRVGKRIQAGIVRVNGPTVQDEPHIPFGGVKHSGYGRFYGKAGIDQFTELRTISIEQAEPHFPI